MRTFTFGFDHKHPITGESLARHYIQVPGDADQSRDIMLAVFGKNWAMQYESPSKLKYLDRMTELKWTEDLYARAADITSLNMVDSSAIRLLRKHLEDKEKAEEIDAYFDDLKARDPKALDALQAEAHAGEAVVEYALKFKSGAHQSLPDSTDVTNIYPIGKQIRHHMRHGATVYRRRFVVVEDWTPVTAEEVEALCEPYDKHMVDFKASEKGPLLP